MEQETDAAYTARRDQLVAEAALFREAARRLRRSTAEEEACERAAPNRPLSQDADELGSDAAP